MLRKKIKQPEKVLLEIRPRIKHIFGEENKVCSIDEIVKELREVATEIDAYEIRGIEKKEGTYHIEAKLTDRYVIPVMAIEPDQ